MSASGLGASILLRQPNCFEAPDGVRIHLHPCQLAIADGPDLRVALSCVPVMRSLASLQLDEGGCVKALGSLFLGSACIAILPAPAAQAHKLTVKRAEAVLRPIAEQMAPEIAPRIAAKLPGATISETGVECTIYDDNK